MGGGGGKGGGSAPAPPNYSALLGQQGAANYGQFLGQTYAGRPNQSNPYGYTQWTPPPLPTGAAAPQASGSSYSPPATPAPAAGPAGSMGSLPGDAGGFGSPLSPTRGAAVNRPAGTAGSPAGTPSDAYAPGALFGGAVPAPTGQWQQQSGFSQPVQNVVNPALAGAGAAASAFNVGNNPTWQGPSSGQANVGYGGPSSAGNLQFNPAGVAQNLYQSQMGLLEPGMQSQSSALDQSLKAQGYDVNQAGGAQTAENNLQNQQNLLRAQTANWAAGQAIPQGAQALQAQESIPFAQQGIAQGYQQGQLNPLMAGTQIGQAQFGAGLQGAQLPISEASGLLGLGLQPANAIPGGSAQVPGMSGVDILGSAQQNYANQISNYNAQQAGQQNFMNGLFGLGSAGALAFLG